MTVIGDGREPTTPSPRPVPPPGLSRLWPWLVGIAVALFVVVGASAPNAAVPGLGPRGWAPGTLSLQLSSAAVTAALAAAYLIGGLAVVVGIRRPDAVRWSWWATFAVGGAMLLVSPFGSADHTNYAAYGQIALEGGDPWVESPIAWQGGADPVTSRVEPPWQATPSIYGPLATLVMRLAALLGNDNQRQVVWVWQVVIVLGWLATRWGLRRLVTDHQRVDALWTANPVIIGIGLGGTHVDMLATLLVVLAVAAAARADRVWGPALLAGVLVGAAIAVKATSVMVVLAVLLAWWWCRRSGFGARLLAFTIGLTPAALLHLWVGPHVFDQLERARRSVSLATPWRPLLEFLQEPLGRSTARDVVIVAAGVVVIAAAVVVWRLTSERVPKTVAGQAMRVVFVLTTAYAIGAAYSLPWYDQLTWAFLPAVAMSGLDVVLLVRSVGLALAYVPGRVVGMAAPVESLTLGFRRQVVPYVVLAVWAGLVTLVMRSRSEQPKRSTARADSARPRS